MARKSIIQAVKTVANAPGQSPQSFATEAGRNLSFHSTSVFLQTY